MNNAIPILLYHRIDDSGDVHVTAPGEFEQHLQLLHELGWHSLSAAEFAAIAFRKKSIPPRSFLITFDDGYESIRTAALAILKKFSFNAICFISTNMVKDRPAAPISVISERDSDLYLSWPQVCELQASGMVDCQSHSHTHSKFRNFSLAEIEDDLVTSVDILSERLRLPRSHFDHLAWPWGLSFPEWRSMAARIGFRLQYSVARQTYRAGAALDQIPRTCFDSYSFGAFQRELWLQTGQFSPLWDSMYPYARKARRIMKLLRGQHA